MKVAAQYPITYTYGYHKDYPINNGFHRGVDRVMPVGTPIICNKTKIGLSGNTGAVFPRPTKQKPEAGAHLHLGRYKVTNRGVVYLNPRNSGFKFRTVLGRKPLVDSTGYNEVNGNFVRIKNWQGQIFVYCHLSKITCKIGDIIK